MKYFVSFILLAAMLFSLAACGENKTANADPTASPTEEVTAAPTDAPTEAPTAAPTEDPTPEPTAVPDPIELDFTACAEIVARLPWGNGEHEVFSEAPVVGVDDDEWVIPKHFYVANGRAYVFDRREFYGNSMLACDLESGETERIFFNDKSSEYEFAVMDGLVIFPDCVFDIETGESTRLQPIPDVSEFKYFVHSMVVRDGKCYAYVGICEFYDFSNTLSLDEYVLDPDNLIWKLVQRINLPRFVPYPEAEEGYTQHVEDRYIGTDAEGNHYCDTWCYAYKMLENGEEEWEEWHRISKISPNGVALSYVDVYFPEDYIRLWDDDNSLIFRVDDEGNIWYMCEALSELLIYRIAL